MFRNLLPLMLLLLLSGCTAAATPTDGQTPAPTWTPVPTGTPEPTWTAMPLPTSAPRFTPTLVLTATPTSVPMPPQTWTPVPTWTPEPTWTAVPLSTPAPTFTPTPFPTATPTSVPTPTPPPCSLAVIGSADELQLVYTRFLASGPRHNTITPLARQVLNERFLEIAPAYIIEFIANPTRHASFRDYLGRVGFQAADANIAAGLQVLQDRGLLPSVGESLYEYNQWRTSDPCTPARSRIFVDDGIMTLLAVGYAIDTTNPFLRDTVVNVTISRINGFRFQDTTTPLIFWVLETRTETPCCEGVMWQ